MVDTLQHHAVTEPRNMFTALLCTADICLMAENFEPRTKGCMLLHARRLTIAYFSRVHARV